MIPKVEGRNQKNCSFQISVKRSEIIGGAGDKSTLLPPQSTNEGRLEYARKNLNSSGSSSDSDHDSSDGSDDPSLPSPSKKKKTVKKSVS